MAQRVEKTYFPDDDGYRCHAWIEGDVERCRVSCMRVMKILRERPWVMGKLDEVEMNSLDDSLGIDLFVPMDSELVSFLGIQNVRGGIPFQIKSSHRNCSKFVYKHGLFDNGRFCLPNNEYFFVLNGLDAEEIILANMVGQMVGLGTLKELSEESVLEYLVKIGDLRMVNSYVEQKEILKECAWYLYNRERIWE